METYRLPNFPPSFSTVHIALFKNLRNAPEIRKRLVTAAMTDGDEGVRLKREVDFGFVEGRLLVSRQHLLTAIVTTLLTCLPHPSDTASSSSTTRSTFNTPVPISSSIQPITRTHNLHSELLLTLSPNNNISDSIRRHGLSDSTDVLAVVRIGHETSSEESVWQEIVKVVDGDLVSLDLLVTGEETDWGRVNKVYKLSEVDRLPLSPSEMQERKIAVVVNTVAVKHVT